MCTCMLVLAATRACSATAVQGAAAVTARTFLACLMTLMSGVLTRLDSRMVLVGAVTPRLGAAGRELGLRITAVAVAAFTVSRLDNAAL